MPRPPEYGIIYNWDGHPHFGEVPQSMERFLELTYAPIEDTQVGAHFWCIGEHAARWKSQGLEVLGDIRQRTYESAYSYMFTENIRLMMERGEDPHQALVERGHELGMQVYASVRMNDNHFNGVQPEDLSNLHHTELTRLRLEHPEWLLGKETEEWYAASWNMSVPEVRQHRFTHVKEACEQCDWDGVELDWQRHAFHLPEDQAYRLRYVLTDLQRAVRQFTRKMEEDRGRPMYVAARVAGSLEMCRRIGYDIPTWVEEDLVDILIPAGNAGTDSSIQVAEFTDLCQDTGIAVYPGFDGGLAGAFPGPEDATVKDRMRTRAISGRYHQAGATGIYVFNWHSDRDARRELLSQIGSAETLRRTDRIYAATHRFIQKEGDWRGAYRRDRIYGEVPVALVQTQTGDGPTIGLEVAEDIPTEAPTLLQLRLRLDEWVKGDVVEVFLDGSKLGEPRVEYCLAGQVHPISGASPSVWFYYDMRPEDVAQGGHAVKAVLVARHPQVACDIVLTDVELVVGYERDGS